MTRMLAAAGLPVEVAACGGSDSASTTTTTHAVRGTPTTNSTARRSSPEDVATLAFGNLEVELTSTRIGAGEPGLDCGARSCARRSR